MLFVEDHERSYEFTIDPFWCSVRSRFAFARYDDRAEQSCVGFGRFIGVRVIPPNNGTQIGFARTTAFIGVPMVGELTAWGTRAPAPLGTYIDPSLSLS